MSKIVDHLKNAFHTRPIVLLLSPVFGITFSVLVYFYHFQIPLFSEIHLLWALLIAIILSVCFFLILDNVTFPTLISLKRTKRLGLFLLVMICSILSFFLLDYDIPHLYSFYPTHTLRIDIDLKDIPAEMEGVSFSQLKLAYRDVGYSELNINGQYEIRQDSIYFPSGQNASITWQGIAGEEALVSFLPANQPIIVQVAWDQQNQELGLKTDSGFSATLASDFPVYPFESLIIKSAVTILVMLITLILFTGIFSPHPYSSIMLIIWLLAYLLYYPGIIGTVNTTAVTELMQGEPTDWHPIIYTLLTAFSIRYLATASSLLLVQIVSLALILGRAFLFLNKHGVSNRALVLFSLLIALWPANIISLITLTNDIPYSIALLALTFQAFRIVLSKGEWLGKPVNQLILALTAGSAILFRYNGIPAVAFFFVCLLIIFPKYWLKILLIVSLASMTWWIINVPLSSALKVTHETEGQFDNILLHHISAHVAEGTKLNPVESEYLNSLLPLNQWDYSCCNNSAMWLDPAFNQDIFHANSAMNRKLGLSLLLRDPSVDLKHMVCASDMIWNPIGNCEIRFPSIEFNDDRFYWTGSDLPEYQESSLLPLLVNPVSLVFSNIEKNAHFISFFWRPAWFLYLSIFCVIILCRRFKNAHWLLLIAPLFGQSAFLLLVNRVQNFRYQYCAVLIGFLLLCMVFYKPPIKE